MVLMRSNHIKQNNQKGGGGKHSFINFEGNYRLDFAVYEQYNHNSTK